MQLSSRSRHGEQQRRFAVRLRSVLRCHGDGRSASIPRQRSASEYNALSIVSASGAFRRITARIRGLLYHALGLPAQPVGGRLPPAGGS